MIILKQILKTGMGARGLGSFDLRHSQRTAVNTTINLRATLHVGNVLSSSKTILYSEGFCFTEAVS
jgi:hypothetical protein